MEAGMVLKRNWRVFFVVACAFASVAASAAEMRLALDPAATPVHYILADPLHTVHGAFKLLRGTIVFDPETGAASGELVVDATRDRAAATGATAACTKVCSKARSIPKSCSSRIV